MGLSFVDRDMIMRYFGGGIGHLGNSPCQANSEQPDTEGVEEEMEIDEDGIDSLNASQAGPGEVEAIIMDFEVEDSDDERGLGPESESDSDEEGSDDDSEGSEEDANERASVNPEDSDDDGYGSF